jgi:peptidoglycan hydrolase CwlO-like protein
VIGVEKDPTTKSGLRYRARRLAAAGAALASLTLVITTTATVVVPQGRVAADQVSDLKAQAAQIARDVVLEQLQIGAFQQQDDVDVAKVQRDQAEIASSQNEIQADTDRVGRDRARLRDEAVSAYVNLGSGLNASQSLFGGTPNTTLARAEYEEVATGDVNLTIDVLHTDESGLRAQRVVLEQQEARDQATTDQETSLTDAANQTEAQLEDKQSEITGQLAVAVAQQQAAQAAAAQAAVRAAQAAAAARTVATTTQSAGSATPAVAQGASAPVSSGGSPALPPFLQCVLQAESSGNYGATSPQGTYMGGFQFSQSTWNEAAGLAGMPQLVNVPPNAASPAEQDDLAIALYDADGEQPWLDPCKS